MTDLDAASARFDRIARDADACLARLRQRERLARRLARTLAL